MKLSNQVALVTGGAQGIGAGIGRRLVTEGAALVVADIDEEKGRALVAEIEQTGGRAAFALCDVSARTQVEAAVDLACSRFGRIDVLVNNAALVHCPDANVHFLLMAEEVWSRTLAVNLTGLFHAGQAAARVMVKQVRDGTAEGGAIINIGSGGGSRAHRQMVAYDTTKGGVEAATRAMALDLAPWRIRVNTLVPGNITVENSLGGAVGPAAAARTIPFARPGTPHELGNAAVFLASADSAYMTGQRLIIDGGMDAQLRSPGVDTQIDRALVLP